MSGDCKGRKESPARPEGHRDRRVSRGQPVPRGLLEHAAKRATQAHKDRPAYRDRQDPPERRGRQGRRVLRVIRARPDRKDRQAPRDPQGPPDHRGRQGCVESQGLRESKDLTDPRACRAYREYPTFKSGQTTRLTVMTSM